MTAANLEQKLERIERLARGNVLGRLVNDPLRYISAIGFWRLIYPLTKRGKFAQARTFFGTEMDVVLPSATEIYLFGAKTHDSEIRLARFLMKNLHVGDVFCDVGAHFGYFSLLASQLVGEEGHVLALEASKSTFDILQKNTAQFSNITPLHRAASDVNKTLIFNEFPALFSEYNSLIVPEVKNAAWIKNNPPRRIEVAGVRLDDFFEEKNILSQVLKIDVEGAELQVLHGLSHFLTENSPLVVMEYLLDKNQNAAHQQAVGFAQTLGYYPFKIKNDGQLELCEDVEAQMAALGLDSDNIVLKKHDLGR